MSNKMLKAFMVSFLTVVILIVGVVYQVNHAIAQTTTFTVTKDFMSCLIQNRDIYLSAPADPVWIVTHKCPQILQDPLLAITQNVSPMPPTESDAPIDSVVILPKATIACLSIQENADNSSLLTLRMDGCEVSAASFNE